MWNHWFLSTIASSCVSMKVSRPLLCLAISQAATARKRSSVPCPGNAYNLHWSTRPLSAARMRRNFTSELQSRRLRSDTPSIKTPSPRKTSSQQPAYRATSRVSRTKEKTQKSSGRFWRSADHMLAALGGVMSVWLRSCVFSVQEKDASTRTANWCKNAGTQTSSSWNVWEGTLAMLSAVIIF